MYPSAYAICWFKLFIASVIWPFFLLRVLFFVGGGAIRSISQWIFSFGVLHGSGCFLWCWLASANGFLTVHVIFSLFPLVAPFFSCISTLITLAISLLLSTPPDYA
jgi:hypothetical protein